MLFRADPFVALDFETCHTDPDSAIALGMVRVEHGEIVDRLYSFVRPRPGREATWMFQTVHGLTYADVQEAHDFAEVWAKARALLPGARFLAAHNAPFDRGVLEASCRRIRMLPPAFPWVCTRGLARQLGISPAGLADACAALKIPLPRHHEADCDAEACARIVLSARGRVVASRA